jgi:hypothetical protein
MERFVVFTGCHISRTLFDMLKVDLEMPSILFIEEESAIINTPFIFEDKKEAIGVITSILGEMTIVFLLDISKSTVYLYKVEDLVSISSLYLPRFLKIYNVMYNEEISSIDTIKDIRGLEIFQSQFMN